MTGAPVGELDRQQERGKDERSEEQIGDVGEPIPHPVDRAVERVLVEGGDAHGDAVRFNVRLYAAASG